MKLWVIKIGTSILRGTENISTQNIIRTYCKYISNFISKGNKVVLVTSGAVGLGCLKLSFEQRPNDLVSLQAAAAVGQVNLMTLYEKEMNKLGNNIAQILITKTDFNKSESFNNASKTFKRLLDLDVIPIVNENDSISNEEIKYGDNDTLSALVALAINANKLILLTDIDKLYTDDPRKNNEAIPILEVYNNNELKEIKNKNKSNNKLNNEWGTGGITTKLLAAEIATNGGIMVQLADGRYKDNLKKIFDEKKVGTIFYPLDKPIKNKKSWLAHAIHTVGEINLDDGACLAIQNKGASILLVGIINVKGDFASNQPVRILNKHNKEIAKGITSLSSDFLKNNLINTVERSPSIVVVHRDVLALT